MIRLSSFLFFFCLALLLLTGSSTSGYSVLTHEAIIDASWKKSIEPLLKQKYPSTNDSDMQKAHAFAYGGAIVADMGYYPFGTVLFTDLLHYVRSGDFVIALLEEAQNVNEYAFALGALAHYTSDVYGHPLGTNLAVPLAYPKVKLKYGNNVTYNQDRTSHLRMEFGFDVLQTARGNYAPLSYHDFIGFQVARPVLERAFLKTYGINMADLFTNLPLAIGSFRWAVKNLVPEATKYAWIIKKSTINKSQPEITEKKFRYKIQKANYYTEFGKEHQRLPIGSQALSWIVRILPKIGPLKGLRFNDPGPEAEKLFIQSFDTAFTVYNRYINHLKSGTIKLENKNFDTGKPIIRNDYALADAAYENLILELKKEEFKNLNSKMKNNIIEFYAEPEISNPSIKKPKEKKEFNEALSSLKNFPLK